MSSKPRLLKFAPIGRGVYPRRFWVRHSLVDSIKRIDDTVCERLTTSFRVSLFLLRPYR